MKKKKLLYGCSLALLLVLIGALLWSIHDAKGRFTVLEYHDFTDDPARATDYTMTTDALRRDLDWLRDKGYVTILPRELADVYNKKLKADLGLSEDGKPVAPPERSATTIQARFSPVFRHDGGGLVLSGTF